MVAAVNRTIDPVTMSVHVRSIQTSMVAAMIAGGVSKTECGDCTQQTAAFTDGGSSARVIEYSVGMPPHAGWTVWPARAGGTRRPRHAFSVGCAPDNVVPDHDDLDISFGAEQYAAIDSRERPVEYCRVASGRLGVAGGERTPGCRDP